MWKIEIKSSTKWRFSAKFCRKWCNSTKLSDFLMNYLSMGFDRVSLNKSFAFFSYSFRSINFGMVINFELTSNKETMKMHMSSINIEPFWCESVMRSYWLPLKNAWHCEIVIGSIFYFTLSVWQSLSLFSQNCSARLYACERVCVCSPHFELQWQY